MDMKPLEEYITEEAIKVTEEAKLEWDNDGSIILPKDEVLSTALNNLLSLARSYLHAIQSGEVPKEMVADDTGLKGHCSNYTNGFNSARSLMLPLIVERDRRIAELKDERIKSEKEWADKCIALEVQLNHK